MGKPFNPFSQSGSSQAGPYVPPWIEPAGTSFHSPGNDSFNADNGAQTQPLLIKGANCIIPRYGIFPYDVRIENGRIAALGADLSRENARVIGAEGKYLIPGVVDPHVHLGLFAPFETEIVTETRSALMNGVTTLGVYLGGSEPYSAMLDRVVDQIRRLSPVDVFLHLVLSTPEQLKELPLYYDVYGIKSFKVYMCGIPGAIPSRDDGFLLDAMEAVAALGDDAVLNIHAENHHIVVRATGQMRTRYGDALSLEDWQHTHPPFAEAEAVQRAVFLAQKTGARVYFVHISSAEACAVIRRLRSSGASFWAETTSPYLTLTAETGLGAAAKMVPPLRGSQDREALWEALGTDLIDTLGTDHTPLTPAEKRVDSSLWDTLPGYPAVGSHLPSLLDGARRSSFDLVKLVEKISLRPAEIFGLAPRKGTLLPGSDADCVLIDLFAEKTATGETDGSRAGYSLHQGKKLIGWPVLVVKGGIPLSPAAVASGEAKTARAAYLKRPYI